MECLASGRANGPFEHGIEVDSKSNSSCFPWREQMRTWEGRLLTGSRNLRGELSAQRSCPDRAARVTGSRLQETRSQAFCCRPWPSQHPAIHCPSRSLSKMPGASSSFSSSLHQNHCLSTCVVLANFRPQSSPFHRVINLLEGTNTQNKAHAV